VAKTGNKNKTIFRHSGLEHFKNIIPHAVHYLGPEFERKYREQFALFQWPKLVGADIARHVHPCGIEHGDLWLTTMSPVWQNQLVYMEKDILDKINTCAGQKIAKKIRFRRYNENISWNTPHDATIVEQNSAAEAERAKRKEQIQKTDLTEAETADIENRCTQIEDDNLRKKFIKAMINGKKAEKWKIANGWHTCADCGTLVEQREKLCLSCQTKREEDIRRRVRQTLTDMPWARPADIKEWVPESTPQIVNNQRSLLVQKYARMLKLEDADSLDAKFLVMLYRVIPPNRLSEQLIRETLYRLRGDLAKPAVFKPIGRAAYIKGNKLPKGE